MSAWDDPAGDRAHDKLVRSRQRARAKVLAIILGAFVILVFAISIAKIQGEIGRPHMEVTH